MTYLIAENGGKCVKDIRCRDKLLLIHLVAKSQSGVFLPTFLFAFHDGLHAMGSAFYRFTNPFILLCCRGLKHLYLLLSLLLKSLRAEELGLTF